MLEIHVSCSSAVDERSQHQLEPAPSERLDRRSDGERGSFVSSIPEIMGGNFMDRDAVGGWRWILVYPVKRKKSSADQISVFVYPP